MLSRCVFCFDFFIILDLSENNLTKPLRLVEGIPVLHYAITICSKTIFGNLSTTELIHSTDLANHKTAAANRKALHAIACISASYTTTLIKLNGCCFQQWDLSAAFLPEVLNRFRA